MINEDDEIEELSEVFHDLGPDWYDQSEVNALMDHDKYKTEVQEIFQETYNLRAKHRIRSPICYDYLIGRVEHISILISFQQKRFWFVSKYEFPAFRDLHDKLNAHYVNNSMTTLQPHYRSLWFNQYVAVRIRNNWFRGRITEKPQHEHVNLHLIDFGKYFHYCHITKIRYLAKRFMQHNAFAHHAMIDDSNDDAVEFAEKLYDDGLQHVLCSATIKSYEKITDSYVVDLHPVKKEIVVVDDSDDSDDSDDADDANDANDANDAIDAVATDIADVLVFDLGDILPELNISDSDFL